METCFQDVFKLKDLNLKLPSTVFASRSLAFEVFVEYYTQVWNGFVDYNPLCFEIALRSSDLYSPEWIEVV